MGAEWFGAKVPEMAVVAAGVDRFLDEVERLSGRTWSQAELEGLADDLQTIGKAVHARDVAVAAQREARRCGCELAAPLLPTGEYDLAKTYVVHGPDCRKKKGGKA